MTDRIEPDFTLAKFLEELKAALAEARPGSEAMLDQGRWREKPRYRTHVMCGNAIPGVAPGDREKAVLSTVMSKLGYTRNDGETRAKGEMYRLFGFEWYKLDLVAATAPGTWGTHVWRGEYRIELALEVENNIEEFTLHMRGLYDFNAAHRVGIFYLDPNENLPIDDLRIRVPEGEDGEDAGEHREDPRQTLRDWTGPSRHGEWGVRVRENEPVTAIFLSLAKPEILGVRQWVPDGEMQVVAIPT